jgi:GTPase SAR1 family protein
MNGSDPQYRILVCGSMAVGKTMLVQNFLQSENMSAYFSPKYRPTIGVNINFRCMHMPNPEFSSNSRNNNTANEPPIKNGAGLEKNIPVMVQIYDLAGLMVDKLSIVAYLRLVSAAIVVIDITRFDTTWLDMVQWNAKIERFVGQESELFFPKLLLCNKCDITALTPEQQVKISNFCIDNGYCGWFETSARTKHNLYAAFEHLVGTLEQYYSKHMETVSLHSPRQPPPASHLPSTPEPSPEHQNTFGKSAKIKIHKVWGTVTDALHFSGFSVKKKQQTSDADAEFSSSSIVVLQSESSKKSFEVKLDRRCDC